MSKSRSFTISSAMGALAKNATFRIAVFCVVWMVALFLLCLGFLGTETILQYSEKNDKPYAVLFFPSARENPGQSESLKIVCLGDSTFFYPIYGGDPRFGKPEDQIPAILEKTLEGYSPGREVSVLSRAFRSATMYNYYCMFYEAEKISPNLIIIPINWATFGAWWKWHLEDNFPELCALAPLCDGLITRQENLIRTKGISPLKQAGYKIGIWSVYPHGMKYWATAGLQSLFGYHPDGSVEGADDMNLVEGWRQKNNRSELFQLYPMELKKSGEEYRQIRAVSNLASKHGVKVLFYITPINLDFMARKGALDQRAFEASKELIIEATRADGAYCLDLSGLLGDEYFTDVTAHYNLEGRQKICDTLAPVVTDILSKMGTG